MANRMFTANPQTPIRRRSVDQQTLPAVVEVQGRPGRDGAPGRTGKTGPRGPRGPAGPGAGRPNLVVRLTMSYLTKDGAPYFASATATHTVLDGATEVAAVLTTDAFSDGDKIALQAPGYYRVTCMREGLTTVDVFTGPILDLEAIVRDAAPRSPGELRVLVEFFEDEA